MARDFELTKRSLDFPRRLADIVGSIFSPQDQPRGLLRGSVFLGETRQTGGTRHAR